MQKVTFEFDNPVQTTFELKVINSIGKEIFNHSELKGSSTTLDISILEAGIYTYFVVQRVKVGVMAKWSRLINKISLLLT